MTPKISTGLAGAVLALRRAGHRVLALSISPVSQEMSTHLIARGIVLDVLHPAELRRAG